MLCPTGAPKFFGGAERLWTGIVEAVNRLTDHDAQLVEVLCPESSFVDLVRAYARCDALDLDHFDMVITGKYPVWMVRHRCHVVYMCHPLRGLYDNYPAGWPTLPQPQSSPGRMLAHLLRQEAAGAPGSRERVLESAGQLVAAVPGDHPDLAFPGPLARSLVQWLDRDALHPPSVVAHLAISRTVAGRPGYFPVGCDVQVVVPPSQLPDVGTVASPTRTPFFFTASRLDWPKRIDLLVDAMQHVASPVGLHIAGTGPAEASLRQRAAHDRRIRFLGRVSDADLVRGYTSCIAVPFVPEDEDLGLITIEAQQVGKPVITCQDSGGSVELVEDGVDGFVVDPDPREIARAMMTLATRPALARQLGEHGRRRAEGITWQRVVDALLSSLATRSKPKGAALRPRVLALSTYPAHPPRHGGQVRLARLLERVGLRADVHLLALETAELTVGAVGQGVWQTPVQRTSESLQLEARLGRELGVPSTDIVAALVGDAVDQVASQLEWADVVVLAHPYLFPAVRNVVGRIPVAYDAHNAEWQLKQRMYPQTPTGRALAEAVADVEAACLRAADLVVAVSHDDVARLSSLSGTLAEVVVVPNGADVDRTEFVTGRERRTRRDRFLMDLGAFGWQHGSRHIALFLGSAHPPNLVAAAEVVAAAHQLPDVMFVLLGGHAEMLSSSDLPGNVLARGVVEPVELAWMLSCSDVAVNPMKSGSGTNIKMVDYFAAGVPVVSSPIGARGLSVTDGLHLLLTEDNLAGAIAAVLADPDGADRRAAAARALAAPFDWMRLGDAFADHVLSLAMSSPTGGIPRPRTLLRYDPMSRMSQSSVVALPRSLGEPSESDCLEGRSGA